MGKAFIRILLIFSLLMAASAHASPVPHPARPTTSRVARVEKTVYITRTGKKYHRADCRYLAQSKIPIKLSEAKDQGYTPCKVCRP
jgi:competence protein ComEC